jgi:hypothetical protein
MTALKPLALAVALLFPLGLLGLLLSLVASQRGRTRAQVGGGLAAISLCVAGAVGVGLWLRAGRGYALIDYASGSVSVGRVRAVDVAGMVAVGALLVVTLLVAKWLTADGVGSGDPTYERLAGDGSEAGDDTTGQEPRRHADGDSD